MAVLNLFTTLNTLHRSAGAVAQLLDISHLYGTPEFSQIQVDAYNLWSKFWNISPFDITLPSQFNSKCNIVLGQHYFITGSTGALSPKFDFTSSGPNKGNPQAYVVAAKAGDLPAPNKQRDVDWLLLNGTSGELATKVIREDTQGGQPPSSVSIFQSTIMTHD